MTNETKPKRSWGCCLLKVFALVFVIGALCVGLAVVSVYRTATWFKNAGQAAPETFPALAVSTGEQQDIDRILFELNTAKQSRELIDESITPTVFNGILEAIIEG